MSIKISVVLAIYNEEKYLRDCLDSIKDQYLRDIEIICVDDGSTDRSMDILREYEKADSRFIILSQKNQGAGAARNYGMSVARGEYLSFLDGDDFFEPDMLETAYRVAKVAVADICVFGANLFSEDNTEFKPCTWSFRKQYFPIESAFSPQDPKYRDNLFRMFNGWAWDKIFRREFIEFRELKFQNLRTTNDMYFVFSALAQADRIVCTDHILAHQRIGITTSLSRTREKSWDCFYYALLALQAELKKVDLYKIYRKAFVNWALNFSLWQLHTIQGENYHKVYELLRTIGFAKLDIAKTPRTFFYSENEYDEFLNMLFE